jgi:ABC-type protease/lipase transport system fused ATPase/permease subunit
MDSAIDEVLTSGVRGQLVLLAATIIQASNAVGAHDFISKMRRGYDTRLE